jgi:hypothetical protein
MSPLIVSALGLIGHKTPEELAKAVNAIQRYLQIRALSGVRLVSGRDAAPWARMEAPWVS